MSGEAVAEVDADAAELGAEGGEDCEVGGLVVEVVAAAVAEVGGAIQPLRGGGRSVNRNVLHFWGNIVVISAGSIPKYCES